VDNNSNWKFYYRDLAGNNAPPGAPQDGNWLLNLVGNCETSGIARLKNMMGQTLPDKEYRFRALAVDYAGNANTAYEGHILRIDATKR